MTDSQPVGIYECRGRSPDCPDEGGAPRILDIDLAIMLASRSFRVVRETDSPDTMLLTPMQ